MKYIFLLKPLFFIFNLVFATWLVFQIEKISPSDFGRYSYLFEDEPAPVQIKVKDIPYLKKLCFDYKAGLIDSAVFELKLNTLLNQPKNGKNRARH